MSLARVSVGTFGGVQDLSRVVNVLALLDLDLMHLSVKRAGSGLDIRFSLSVSPRGLGLCLARLGALAAVERAGLVGPVRVQREEGR
jgi:hypothetical protein